MNELSLFSGAGGGLLATKHLLNWRTVGYVEYNKYCQKILAQRIEDGFLDEAPIFGDINGFIESGAAKKYKGVVEVLTAGFPCPAYSVAGKREGKNSEKNLWKQTLAVIRDTRPKFAFLENVPGLLTVNGGEMFAQILGDLAEIRFDARWTCLGADQCGAPHKRTRLWLVAFNSDIISLGWKEGRSQGIQPIINESEGQESQHVCKGISKAKDLADTSSEGSQGSQQCGNNEEEAGQRKESATRTTTERSSDDWGNRWPTEPQPIRRVAHGVANRMDKLQALGNGQVSSVVATAWKMLTHDVV